VGFVPPLKDCVRIAVQGAADAAGGLLRIALGTPGVRVWSHELNTFVETGKMWDGSNPINLLVEAGVDGLETCLIDGYGEPGGGGPGGEVDHFLASNGTGLVIPKGSFVELNGNSRVVPASLASAKPGRVAGIAESDIPAGPAGTGYIRPGGAVQALLAGGLSPVGGDRMFLSATDGRATVTGGLYDLGLVVDAASYVGTTPANSVVTAIVRPLRYIGPA